MLNAMFHDHITRAAALLESLLAAMCALVTELPLPSPTSHLTTLMCENSYSALSCVLLQWSHDLMVKRWKLRWERLLPMERRAQLYALE